MGYLALYRKYRPSEFEEMVGQNEIRKILANAVKNNTISHAYLFSGPRGTGKTTTAKILAKMVNCEAPVDGHPCNKCNSCLNILNSSDVIEIDAASNNGVDEIRDLREKANLVPSNSKYKVYIIDEVHMLTTQAFNALLKTLEEPPKHVIFILATTEYYKIPLTITSRCQKFQFNKIEVDDIVKNLKEICEKENISIEDDALYEIAMISDGGMRDSINFLDQLRSFNNGKITIDDVYEVCGDVSGREISELLKDMKDKNVEKVTCFFEKMSVDGKNYNKFFEDLIGFFKDVILYQKNVSKKLIRNNIEYLDVVSKDYSVSEIYYMIDFLNSLYDKLRYVSRQGVFVIANFLLLMNKIDNINEKISINVDKKSDKTSEKKDYELAFKFTSNKELNDSNNDDNIVKNDVVDDDNITQKVNDNKEIIINNTFAVADKKIKSDLQERYTKISDYLTDKRYATAASLLVDTKIEVAGDGYVLMTGNYEALVENIYNNYHICEELINLIFNDKYRFVVITNKDWEKHRDEYINNIRNGKKYILKNIENTLIDDNILNSEPTVVDKLFELVGNDVIEFK